MQNEYIKKKGGRIKQYNTIKRQHCKALAVDEERVYRGFGGCSSAVYVSRHATSKT